MLRNSLINLSLFAGVLACIEAVSFFMTGYLKARGVFYNAPVISNYDTYLTDRHPSLGWPSKSHLAEKYDSTGSRPIPSFPDTSSSCVSLYGDSFTWSDLVPDEEAWSNVLSNRLGCRVSNYGVSGYGTDQMLLRYQENSGDKSPVVVLNHFSGDIRRNVTQMRNLMAASDSQYILLKPRFTLEGDGIKLIPLPFFPAEQAQAVADSPEEFLTAEFLTTEISAAGVGERFNPASSIFSQLNPGT